MFWKLDVTSCIPVTKGTDEIAIQLRYDIYPQESDSCYLFFLRKKNGEIESSNKIVSAVIHHFILIPISFELSLINSIGNQLVSIVKEMDKNLFFENGGLPVIPNSYHAYEKFSGDALKIALERINLIIQHYQ